MMKLLIEEVFRTEGIPEYTFVKPPNFNEILVDLRNPGKPVVIEGQSGTGKTTVATKIIERINADDFPYAYLSARKAEDVSIIHEVSSGEKTGLYVIDDFHRLAGDIQSKLADLVKIAAEVNDPAKYPKVVIIGINKVGSELIGLVPDIAKRCGIHKILPASQDAARDLIKRGEDSLNIVISNKEQLVEEADGDYWLLQLLSQTVCLDGDVLETQERTTEIAFTIETVRSNVVSRLEHTYSNSVKEFCRGKRFRSTNDPYFKLLREVGRQDSSIVDLQMLANSTPEVRGSINNIKEKRLTLLLQTKPNCEQYFYYNSQTKNFAIEDPALFYYLKHLDWEDMRQECGFRHLNTDYEFDVAISFAGENRDLASLITKQLEDMDFSVFYDRNYESNYLGGAWTAQFGDIFGAKSRFVVALLDSNHQEKIWPTFERQSFVPRVREGAVIPVFLDDTNFLGIPNDTIGIHFKSVDAHDSYENQVADSITFRIVDRLDDV